METQSLDSFCQSCGMPMNTPDAEYGTEADGSLSKDYCSYCYDNGAFTGDYTMQGMIDLCAPHMEENAGMSEADARKMMAEFYPSLKRWQGA